MSGLPGFSRVAVLALAAAASLSAYVVGVPQAEFRQTYALNPNGRVLVQNAYGDVRIIAWDRDEVQVQAVKKSRDPGHLSDARILVDSGQDLVSISTQYVGADAEHPATVDYRIMVPRGANLENIRLTNGVLWITGVAGTVKAFSVNGSIKAERLSGQADLSTVNGQVDAEFEQISVENPILLKSVNGPIKLSIPSGAGACVDARNRSGGIDSAFGRSVREASGNRLRTVVRSGGPRIQLHNVNGGISIRAAINKGERPWS
jgi:hypothetical protein